MFRLSSFFTPLLSMASIEHESSWSDALFSNHNDVTRDVVALLLTYVDNILSQPDESKYRTLRKENEIFSRRVLPVKGAVDCLRAMGFREMEEAYVMSREFSVDTLLSIKQVLSVRSASVPSNRTFTQQEKDEFYYRLESSAEHVRCYSSEQLREEARRKIPVDDLRRRASALHRSITSQAASTVDDNVSEQECLLLELLHWFKADFFRWCDKPECDFCHSPPAQMNNAGMAYPSDEERVWRAGSVEVYSCSLCGSITRFPRYNHPGKLLETRRGRCGEWANCFTL